MTLNPSGKTDEEQVPPVGWILVGQNWLYNDEVTVPDGVIPEPVFFRDRAVAERECARRCAEFFAAQTPQEFEVDFDNYGDGSEDLAALTWDDLRERGFPDPYMLLPLTAFNKEPS
jgi:hypothetical protein